MAELHISERLRGETMPFRDLRTTRRNELLYEAASHIEKLESNMQLQLEWYLSNKRVLDDRIEKLEEALHNVTTAWDIWQKTSDSNSFTELFACICEAKALEGKDDIS